MIYKRTRTDKRCPRCKTVKLVAEFHKSRAAYDGVASYCKICINALSRQRAQLPKYKAFKAKYRSTPEYKEREKLYKAKDRARHAKHYKARRVVRDAIKKGELWSAKTSECVYCGEQANGWHHWAGYEEEHWMDVIPLCQKCDRKAHKEAS